MRAVIICVFVTIVIVLGIWYAATEGIVGKLDKLEVWAYYINNDDHILWGKCIFGHSADNAFTYLSNAKQVMYCNDFLLSGRDCISSVAITMRGSSIDLLWQIRDIFSGCLRQKPLYDFYIA